MFRCYAPLFFRDLSFSTNVVGAMHLGLFSLYLILYKCFGATHLCFPWYFIFCKGCRCYALWFFSLCL